MKEKTVWKEWELYADYWVNDGVVYFNWWANAKWVNCWGMELGSVDVGSGGRIIGDS